MCASVICIQVCNAHSKMSSGTATRTAPLLKPGVGMCAQVRRIVVDRNFDRQSRIISTGHGGCQRFPNENNFYGTATSYIRLRRCIRLFERAPRVYACGDAMERDVSLVFSIAFAWSIFCGDGDSFIRPMLFLFFCGDFSFRLYPFQFRSRCLYDSVYDLPVTDRKTIILRDENFSCYLLLVNLL